MSPVRVPDVSVVIPAFNSAAYLAQAIESVLAQSRPPLETIVIDDGSVDDTRAVALAYPVCYVYQENRDRAAARNAGAELARGSLIAFLDADDVWMPEHLAACVEALERRPEASACATNYVIADERLTPIGWARATERSRTLAALLVENSIATSTVVVRAETFRQAGGFDESLKGSEDWELWLRLAATAPIGHVEATTVVYRDREGSASDRALDVLADRIFLVCERVYTSAWLPVDLRPLRNRSEAWSALLVAINYALNGRRTKAAVWLARAVRFHPAVLLDSRWRVTLARTILPLQAVRVLRRFGARRRRGSQGRASSSRATRSVA